MANNLTPAPPPFPAHPADPAVAPHALPSAPPPGGWAVAAGRGVDWWKEGWRLFMAAPLIWIVITVLFVVIMFCLALIPFIGQIASTLLYPVMGAGVLIGSRALDRGGQLTVGHLFSCFNDKAVPLIIVALLYFGGWLVIWMIAAAIMVGIAGFSTLSSLMSADPLEAGVAMLSGIGLAAMLVLLLMALLGVPLIMAHWFAPALVVFRGDQPIAALKSSFTASLRNIPPFLVYSLLGLLFAIVATIPLGLGGIVLAPVYAATLWPSYKDIFGEPG